MKPARERFFPTPSTHPPLRSSSSNSGGKHRGQDSVLSALDQNTGITTQMYPAFLRKLGLGTGGIPRPGTAEPRVSDERAMNVRIENGRIPVIAPTPKRYHISPPFTLPDGPFESDALDTSRDNHSSKSPDNLIAERQEESFKMPFPKKVHQRVSGQPEPSQYHPKMLQRRGEPSPTPNDGGDQDVSVQRNKKRTREPDEVEDPDIIERSAKRFKNHEVEDDDKMSCHESRSPHPARPSSTVSAINSYHGRPNGVVIHTPPAQHLHLERQGTLNLNPTITSKRSHVGPPGRKPSEPVGLDKLLGLGSNDLLDQYAGKYEALLKRWSECSVEEWKAGADEISARFTMMLDFAKDHVEKKLKAYSSLNAVLDSHREILRERSESIKIARQDAVKIANKVLG